MCTTPLHWQSCHTSFHFTCQVFGSISVLKHSQVPPKEKPVWVESYLKLSKHTLHMHVLFTFLRFCGLYRVKNVMKAIGRWEVFSVWGSTSTAQIPSVSICMTCGNAFYAPDRTGICCVVSHVPKCRTPLLVSASETLLQILKCIH